MVFNFNEVLRIDYCGFGLFCSTRTKLVIFFTSEGTHVYYILIKRQIIRLSNDISDIKMGKRMLLKTSLWLVLYRDAT